MRRVPYQTERIKEVFSDSEDEIMEEVLEITEEIIREVPDTGSRSVIREINNVLHVILRYV